MGADTSRIRILFHDFVQEEAKASAKLGGGTQILGQGNSWENVRRGKVVSGDPRILRMEVLKHTRKISGHAHFQ